MSGLGLGFGCRGLGLGAGFRVAGPRRRESNGVSIVPKPPNISQIPTGKGHKCSIKGPWGVVTKGFKECQAP